VGAGARTGLVHQAFVERATRSQKARSRPGNPGGTAPAHAALVRRSDVKQSRARRDERIPTVKELDIQNLGPGEQKLLELSFQPGHTEKRVRNILWSALMLFAGLLLFSLYGLSLLAITGFALVIVINSAI
jgi:Flp pilus assembly protein TadB